MSPRPPRDQLLRIRDLMAAVQAALRRQAEQLSGKAELFGALDRRFTEFEQKLRKPEAK